MKIATLLFLSSIAANTLASEKPIEYRCSCVDTKGECDGQENLNVTLTDDVATIELGSEDWEFNDSFEAKVDAQYEPKTDENKKYTKYSITDGGGGYDYDSKKSYFLVSQKMQTRAKKGTVKFQVVSEHGGFMSYLYQCKKD